MNTSGDGRGEQGEESPLVQANAAFLPRAHPGPRWRRAIKIAEEVAAGDRSPRGASLTRRILAVNLIALSLAGISLFFIDDFRNRLITERREQEVDQAHIIAIALRHAVPDDRNALLIALGRESRQHLRIHDRGGRVVADNWALDQHTYRLVDPSAEGWRRQFARGLDRLVDRLVGADRPDSYTEPRATDAPGSALQAVLHGRAVGEATYFAPDRTLILTTAVPIDRTAGLFLTTSANARDVTRLVRAERLRLGLIVAASLLLSAALSVFLARTIARPLRRLAKAANRVKMGRDREVVVPRLPSRHDEIGTLARAISDMTAALRGRIDAMEAFAADVSHELKNPLASLRSAVETLARVKDPEAQAQMLAIVDSDVRRLDRLISEIAELSRMDAGLTRTRFEPVDIGKLVEALLAERFKHRGADAPSIAFARPARGLAMVMGDASPLDRAIGNLVDNAMSFSPPGGRVRIDATRVGRRVMVAVEDEGPGVAPEAREAIFARFHSDRPSPRSDGRHSGLGLSIARTIIEAHDGRIEVCDAQGGGQGARFVVWLPAYEGGGKK